MRVRTILSTLLVLAAGCTRAVAQYDVAAPKGVQPRDINNFWLATDPVDPDRGLFDSDRYTGKFSSYDKMHGYYASTGGGGAVANLTTRMRRYPREVDGKPAEHIALNDKDGQPGYLITPDKVMSVQLVAYDDVVQYIVDGKMRGGIRLYLASRATVTNSTAIDCGTRISTCLVEGRSRGRSGTSPTRPLSDFRLSKSRQNIELTILPSPHAVGPHNVADIQGDDHDIVFHRSDGPIDTDRRPIVVTGDDSTIRNETEYPIVLQSSASGNTVVSFGPVTDLGTDNNVSRFRQPKSSEH